MKKIFLAPLFLLLAFTASTYSQIYFEYDYARFKYDDKSSFLEIYYYFDQTSLKQIQTEGKNYVSALLSVNIADTVKNIVVVNNQWQINNEIKDTASKGLIGTLSFIVPQGEYQITVGGKDGNNPASSKVIKDKLYIDKFADSVNIPYVSDIQLAGNIIKDFADTSSIFYKNTLEVIPQPNPIYGGAQPIVFYYCEIYNLDKADSLIKLRTTISNSQGQQVFSKEKDLKNSNSSIVEIGTVNIAKYPTDSYYIKLNTINASANKELYASLKKFYVYNPDVEVKKEPLQESSLLGSEFGIMSEEECDDLFEKSKYLMTSAQINEYKKNKELDAKRNFLFNLWKKLDTDPNTPINEFKNEYLERVRISNERYASMGRKGMKTDRGRIYILYGQPDQIDRYPNSTNMKPYEVWSYNSIEGGVYFVFGDISGFGNYELLNSNKRGEIQNDDWESRLTVE